MSDPKSTLASDPEWTGKGAVEQDAPPAGPNLSNLPDPLASQLGHRDQNELLKSSDTDFPGPDAEGEISSE